LLPKGWFCSRITPVPRHPKYLRYQMTDTAGQRPS
jgi:hypothetical protein